MFLLEIAQRWLYFVFEILDVQDYLFAILYGLLIFDNFKYSDLAYHFFVEELFLRNASRLEEVTGKFSSYFDANWRSCFDYVIKAFVNLFTVVISYLPESVQPIFNLVVNTAGNIATTAAGSNTDVSESESDASSVKGD